MTKVSILLFEDFETLDVFGPVEIFGILKEHYQVSFYSLAGGLVHNSHGVAVHSRRLEEIAGGTDVFLIPGGFGTRKEVHNEALMQSMKIIAEQSGFVLTVCTGSGLLAKTGLLNGKQATSNKKAFDWAASQGPEVLWQRKARWTADEKWYTSAGVSAGMDMTLGFLADRHGIDFAREAAFRIEYEWTEDKEQDRFYQQ